MVTIERIMHGQMAIIVGKMHTPARMTGLPIMTAIQQAKIHATALLIHAQKVTTRYIVVMQILVAHLVTPIIVVMVSVISMTKVIVNSVLGNIYHEVIQIGSN